MTSADIRTRARLAAAFDDADAIEARPIEEVRAALQQLGVDPESSINFAKRLARTAADPAARLLQQTLEAEDIDAEITALETASIDDVKAAFPPGIQASVDETIRQRADQSSSVTDTWTEKRRRRFSALGWGGSLVGIAASVLLFIAIRPDRLEQAEAPLASIAPSPPAVVEADRADALTEKAFSRTEKPAPPLALEPRRPQSSTSAQMSAPADTIASRDVTTPTGAASPVESEAELANLVDIDEEAGAGQASSERREETAARPLTDSLERARVKETPLSAPPIPAPDRRSDLLASNNVPLAEMAQEQMPAPIAPVSKRAQVGGEVAHLPLPDNLSAILLVDPAGAPPILHDLANHLSEDRLAARLDDARLHSAGRTVIALVAFLRGGERVEAALVGTIPVQPAPEPRSQSVTGVTAFTESAPADIVAPEARFELIELPADR